MKVLFIHQYFHPDVSSVSQVISQVAFHVAASGCDVSVLCSRNRYDRGESGRLPAREMVGGVAVRRCWGPSLGRTSMGARLVDMASFCVLAAFRALSSPRADTVVLLTNPPLFSVLGSLLKSLRGERFVYVIMDLYPEVAVKAGVMRAGSAMERLARRLSANCLADADRVVVLGDDMKEAVVRAGAPAEKVVVIRNWADPDAVRPVDPGRNALRKSWGMEGKFVVAYSGNFGVSHLFDEIVQAAADLRDHDDIRFLFIGGGVRRKDVEAAAAGKRLANVTFLPYQKASDLSESLSAGDVHYVSLRPGFEGLVVPSKAYGIMAAGRPIVYQGAPQGEVARMVEREGLGIVLPPGDSAGLRDAILRLRDDRRERLRMGAAAREALEARYAAPQGLSLYRRVIVGDA